MSKGNQNMSDPETPACFDHWTRRNGAFQRNLKG
jgi:hypothetical protein